MRISLKVHVCPIDGDGFAESRLLVFNLRPFSAVLDRLPWISIGSNSLIGLAFAFFGIFDVLLISGYSVMNEPTSHVVRCSTQSLSYSYTPTAITPIDLSSCLLF